MEHEIKGVVFGNEIITAHVDGKVRVWKIGSVTM